MKVDIQRTRSKQYTATVSYFEETLNKEVKVALCSKYDPVKEGNTWAETVYEEGITTFVVYGIGMGYHISALLEYLKEWQKVYVIDVNKEVWKEVREYTPLKDITSTQCEVHVTDQLVDVVKVLERIEDKQGKLSIYIPSMKIIPHRYAQLKHILEIHSISKIGFDDKALIEENYKYNNVLSCANVSQLYGCYQNKPIIIVSGGPSLDKNIDQLKNISNEIIVFSTARTLKTLVDKGIRADLFCMIDAKPWMVKQLEGIEHLEIPFIFLNTACAEAVKRYQGPKYRAYSMDYPKEQEGRIESGGSVATAMLDSAIKMGGNPIIFIGQDLAYTNDVTHCNNNMGVQRMNKDGLKQTKGFHGDTVYTTSALLSYKYWIEKKIRQHQEIAFINATEGGAYIEGCQHSSLEQIVKTYHS